MKAAKRLAALAPGTVVEILSDDPLAAIDLPLFCRQEGQVLLAQESLDGQATRFRVRRGAEAPGLARG